jgi:hypothetical protein
MKFDRQDALLLIGMASLLGGIYAWSRPAAFVVGGLICLAHVYLIEIAKKSKKGADGSANK